MTTSSGQLAYKSIDWRRTRQRTRVYTRALKLILLSVVTIGVLISARSLNQNVSVDPQAVSAPGFYLPVDSSQLRVLLQPLEPSEIVAQQLGDIPFEARRLQSGSGEQELIEGLEDIYHFEYDIAKPLTIPDTCFDFGRRQYNTELLMEWLEQNSQPGSFRTIGLLYADMYQGDFEYLFGQSRLAGTVCVASSARLANKVSEPKLKPRERWRLLVGHELGHTLGLQHVSNPHSLMAYSRDLEGMDKQGTRLTRKDWAQLRKLQPIKWER